MKIILSENLEQQNPYVRYLSDEYKRRGVSVIFGMDNFFHSTFLPDFVHIQWPESIYRKKSFLNNKETMDLIQNRLAWYSENKIPIVYTVHNMLPHEKPNSFDRDVFSLILSNSGIIVHHGKSSIEMVKKEFPECKEKNHIITPHGPHRFIKYDSFIARKEYKLPKNKYIILNFGRQVGYKGGPFSKKVFRAWNNPNTYFFTIGKISKYSGGDGLYFKLRTFLKKQKEEKLSLIDGKFRKREKLIFRTVREDEVSKVMAATDIVFLGHQSGLNSGILPLAASYGKPVVFPDIGNFEDQVKGFSYYDKYDNSNLLSAKSAIERMYERIRKSTPGNTTFDNKNWLKHNSWEKHVDIILENVKKTKK